MIISTLIFEALSDITVMPSVPEVLLSVHIYEFLAMLPPSTPGHIPRRLSVPDPAVVVPSAIHTLSLPPVVNISVPPLRPAPVHAINAQAVKVFLGVLNSLLDPPVPTYTTEVAVIPLNPPDLAEVFELLELFEYCVDRALRKGCLERVGFGLNECSEVVPSS